MANDKAKVKEITERLDKDTDVLEKARDSIDKIVKSEVFSSMQDILSIFQNTTLYDFTTIDSDIRDARQELQEDFEMVESTIIGFELAIDNMIESVQNNSENINDGTIEIK